MPIKKIRFPNRRPKGKQPRVTIAIEPRVARLFRELARVERLQLSELLEQALVAWIRRWRPEYDLEVEGPEGPDRKRPIFAVGGFGPTDPGSGSNPPAAGLAHRITEADVQDYGTAQPNPPRSTAPDDAAPPPAMPRRKFAKEKADKDSNSSRRRAPNRRSRQRSPKRG